MAENGTFTGNETTLGTAMSKRGQMFWNAYANLKSQIDPNATFDPTQELLTYIQADARYVDYHQMYVDSVNGLTDVERAAKQEAALIIHRESNLALDAIDARGAYDTDVQGAANDFYFLIEQNYPSVQLAEPVIEEAIQEEIIEPVSAAPVTEAPLPLNGTPLFEHFIVANYTADTVAEPVADVANSDENFNEDWALEQFGPLAETPVEAIEPNVEPVAPEVVPEPFLWTQERPIEEPAIEDDGVSVYQFQTQEPDNDFQMYEIERGDNLWNIAKDYYGFGRGDDAAIMEAVTKISILNGLDEGTDANNLRIGQELKLPDSPSLTDWNAPDTRLDWEALDEQTAARKASFNLGGNFSAAVQNLTIAPVPAPVPVFRSEPLQQAL